MVCSRMCSHAWVRGRCAGAHNYVRRLRNADVSGVHARQAFVLAKQPVVRQLSQRGVGTGITAVSVCVTQVCEHHPVAGCCCRARCCVRVSDLHDYMREH
jgi:hypothetical protein